MINPYIEYYSNQAGSGLGGFEGYRYQRGHGFFGTLFQNIIKPLGKYLGKQALQTGVKIGNDLLQGENLGDTFLKNMKTTGNQLITDTLNRVQKFAQTGKGRKRRSRNKIKNGNKKKKTRKRTLRKSKTVKKVISKRKIRRKSKKSPKFSTLF